MRRSTTLLAVCFALVTGVGTAAGQQAPAVFTLKPGDMVRVTVWRKPELSGDFRVLADGSIAHPLYQAINVTGGLVISTPVDLTAIRRSFGDHASYAVLNGLGADGNERA